MDTPATKAPLTARLRGVSRFCLRLSVLGAVPALFLVIAPDVRGETVCTDCHEIQPAAFSSSVHGGMECVDCHEGAATIPHEETPSKPECSACHEEVASVYAGSVHGQARINGKGEAAGCADCHGPFHEIVPSGDPASPVHPARQPATCGRCHANPEMVAKFKIPVARPIEAYEASVHARAVAAGEGGATCSTCHSSHALYASSDPRSSVSHQSVAKTCAACHGEVAEAYSRSVHGVAAAHGAREAPVCTDCHGEHRILAPSEPGSPVYATNIPKMTCGRCHGDLRLAEKYGLDAGNVTSYQDSYHGLAARAGEVTVAHCGSCHGVHAILPSSDPKSPIHPNNLASTCGKCHPGAGASFAIGKVHVLATEPEHAAVYWARRLYILLIWVVVGGMLLHNGLDLYRKARGPLPLRPPPGFAGESRMLPGFRAVHVLTMASFGVLVYTGFALTYPESWWARVLLQWEEGFAFRGWLHRAAAVVMLASLALHALHILVSRPARRCIALMRPTRHDVTELRTRLLYLIGRRPVPPPSPSVGYPEKMEYIALMWGILVMAATGGILWFENIALRYFPKWFTDVATVIHFYEAVLATLAILVWHFYFVIFDPVVYPMDTAWLTGRAHPGRSLERRASLHPLPEPLLEKPAPSPPPGEPPPTTKLPSA